MTSVPSTSDSRARVTVTPLLRDTHRDVSGGPGPLEENTPGFLSRGFGNVLEPRLACTPLGKPSDTSREPRQAVRYAVPLPNRHVLSLGNYKAVMNCGRPTTHFKRDEANALTQELRE